ncbi:MAG: GNAT family N-acetyltransferase [Ignavibacteria bacterium]|nr:GNAT family N-acetyltransferase [Ignavibacteria bacterium]
MRSIIFKCSIPEVGKEFNAQTLSPEYKIVFWKPTLTEFVPESYPKKYFLYWVFHYFGFFKNRNYSAILIYHNSQVVSCILAIPAYFKWPFMDKKDVQIAYVITDKDYRGKGLAAAAILESVKNLKYTDVENIWYVTSEDNHSSIKLCTKLGFKPMGYGARKYIMKFLHILQIQKTKINLNRTEKS